MVGADLERVEAMLWRLSDRSRYHRFFSQAPSGVGAELEYLGSVDGRQRVALVADDGLKIVGVARYHGLAGTTANAANTTTSRPTPPPPWSSRTAGRAGVSATG